MRRYLPFFCSKLNQLFAIVIVGLAAATAAYSDPIVITGGSATIFQTPFPHAPITLTGQNFSANVVAVNGNFGVADCHFTPCTGASLSWTSSGTDLQGTFTVNGMVFPSNINNQLFLQFNSATFVIPPEFLGAPAILITAPFTLSGLIFSASLPATIPLTGEGTVHLFLVRQDFGGPLSGFFLDHADYIFGPRVSGLTIEPVPEPMTILLFLSGLSGTAIHLRQRRRRMASLKRPTSDL